MTELTIALTKGRILEETLPLFAQVGIEPLDDIHRSRKLIFSTNHPHIKFLLLRGVDVPTYVRFGSADIGVVGKDTLIEAGAKDFYEPIDLGIARCRMMTAGLKNTTLAKGRIKVATKYVEIAKKYYSSQGRQVDIIKLYGAMEIAPVMGLADEIVDIVDTGNTLRANGLEERDFIADVSSRLIVNKAAYKTKHALIKPLLDEIKLVVAAEEAL